MFFINTTGNTVPLYDINKNIPFIGNTEQELSTELILHSNIFQLLILQQKFIITKYNESRIETNLYKLQNNIGKPIPDCKVHFKGHFFGNSGFSKVNKNLLYSLSRYGCNCTIDSINGIAEEDKDLLNRYRDIPHPDSIFITSSVPTFANKPEFKYNILYTTTESITIPKQFVDICNQYNEIWVPSQFCYDVYKKYIDRPIFIVPNSVDNRIYQKGQKSIKITPNDKTFIFLSVLSWNWRKGYDLMLKSYLKAFSGDDDIALLLVTPYQKDYLSRRKYIVDKEIRQFINDFGGNNSAKIMRYGNSLSELELARLYNSVNAFILMSRGEGFSLTPCEASLCGLPIISTNWSGQTMFLNKDNSTLIDIDNLKKGETGIHFWDTEEFPELNSNKCIDDTIDGLRWVYKNYNQAVEKNKDLQNFILSNYSTEIVGKIAFDRIKEVWNYQ